MREEGARERRARLKKERRVRKTWPKYMMDAQDELISFFPFSFFTLSNIPWWCSPIEDPSSALFFELSPLRSRVLAPSCISREAAPSAAAWRVAEEVPRRALRRGEQRFFLSPRRHRPFQRHMLLLLRHWHQRSNHLAALSSPLPLRREKGSPSRRPRSSTL